ncbi:hypothetical protein [Orbus sasakiae]|uniref:hypothetical protein n=1 Tax=Orbus sasakiae TaxID=1078475 RepID=UPI0031EFE6D9
MICLIIFIVSRIRRFMDDPKEGMKNIGNGMSKMYQQAKDYAEKQNNRNKE